MKKIKYLEDDEDKIAFHFSKSSREEAHEVWRKRKHELAQLVAATESDMRVVEALKKRYSIEEWYSEHY